jgi:eukaryotic-like serine/threonine-protein kinase
MQQQAPWLVAQRYEVGEVVGRGGYGMVCRGVDRETGQAVALKMLSPEAGRDPDIVERMLREQQALVALRGTCAVTPVDLCRLDSGAPCLVMEWLDGRDLEMLLSEREAAGQLGEPAELLTLLEPVAQTLARAHDIGLVHRDIKPANIFLTSGAFGTPPARLLDFGLSRMKSAAPITAAGMVMGSPSYIAPETWAGDSRALDGRADLFSLAVIVFRWLTGTLPFDAPDLISKMTAVTTGARPSVLTLRPDLPRAVDLWMQRALAIRPDHRFQSGGDFYEALAAAARGDELPTASAEASGIRKVSSAADAPPRKNPLASAWQTATSLLKRLTARDEDSAKPPGPEPPPPPAVVIPPAEEPPKSDRASIWLDPDELEDVASQRPATPPPPPPPRAAHAGKSGKAKKKAEKKPHKAKKHKASSKSKKGRKRSKKS